MRSPSPVAGSFPYVSLFIVLRDGRTKRYDDISASAKRRDRVEAIIDAINARSNTIVSS